MPASGGYLPRTSIDTYPGVRHSSAANGHGSAGKGPAVAVGGKAKHATPGHALTVNQPPAVTLTATVPLLTVLPKGSLATI